jgi:hypothetical protein
VAEVVVRPAVAQHRERLLTAARDAGLLDGPKSTRLSGRFPDYLVKEAQRITGLTEPTELLTYALSKVALEDDFGERLLARKGRVQKGLLGQG